MAALCSSSTPSLGISHFNNKGKTNVIVTFSTLGVQIFDPEVKGSFQKCWVPQTQLTFKTMQHPQTGQFWCVENKNTLCNWDLNTNSFNEATRRTFPKNAGSVFALHAAPEQPFLIVLFANGKILLVDGQQQAVLTKPSKGTLFGSYLLSHPSSSPSLLCVVTQAPSSTRYSCSIYSMSYSNSKLTSEFTLEHSTATLSGFAAYYTSNYILLSCVWSDHSWQFYKWTVDSDEPELIFSRSLTCFAPQSTVSCIFVDADAVVLAGTDVDSPHAIVTTWDTKYGTLHSTTPFTEAAVTGDEIDLCYDALSQNLFLSLEKAVVSCHVSCPAPTLATVLGRCVGVPDENALGSMPVVTPDTLADPSAWIPVVEAQNNSERLLLQQLLPTTTGSSKAKSLSAAQFTQILTDYISGKSNSKTKKRKAENKNGGLVARTLSEVSMRRLAEHCVSRYDLWDAISVLLSSNVLSVSSCPTLLRHLTAHHQYTLLALAFAHLKDIPETDLVRVAQIALTLTESSSSTVKSKKSGRSKAQASVSSPSSTDVMNLALSAPHHKVFLCEALRNLSSNQVLNLLKHLTAVMRETLSPESSPSSTKSRVKSSSFSSNKPTVSQILDWCIALIDVHFIGLVRLVQQEKKASAGESAVEADLRLISELAQAQIATRENMKTLKGVISHSLQQYYHQQRDSQSTSSQQGGRGRPVKKTRTRPPGDYSITVIEL